MSRPFLKLFRSDSLFIILSFRGNVKRAEAILYNCIHLTRFIVSNYANSRGSLTSGAGYDIIIA